MNIFSIASVVPYPHHDREGVTAVHIVVFELLRCLIQRGHRIYFLPLFSPYRSEDFLSELEEQGLDHVETLGVESIAPVFPQEYRRPPEPVCFRRRLQKAGRLLAGNAEMEEFYPSVSYGDKLRMQIESAEAEIILTLWSPEGNAATCGFQDVPRIAYQGDVDYFPLMARMKDRATLDWKMESKRWVSIRGALDRFRQLVNLVEFKRAHLSLMRNVDVVANVTASNAEYYTKMGHPKAIYVQNTWVEPRVSGNVSNQEGRRDLSSQTPVKIIGHVGYLDRTGGTYGLHFLLMRLLPELKTVMQGIDYEIHIIGGGEIIPALRPMLRQERIVVRGHVKDLDRELASSDVFLFLNNAGRYLAAYTRHIVAWSLGLCLVVHANSKRAIPEITHGENALMGETEREIAQMVCLASTDPAVNRRVREGGRITYQKYFSPKVVSGVLEKVMQEAVEAR